MTTQINRYDPNPRIRTLIQDMLNQAFKETQIQRMLPFLAREIAQGREEQIRKWLKLSQRDET